MSDYIDVTEKWIKQAKPKKGNIHFLNYVITQEGERFDFLNSVLSVNVDDDFLVGTWFKNNVWGNCRFQPSIDSPQGKRSADIRLFGKCSLVEEKTIEIKTLTSSRRDGIVYRLKQAKGQSSNVLLDISNYPYDLETIKHELNRYFISHDWIRLVAIKKNNGLLFVWQKI